MPIYHYEQKQGKLMMQSREIAKNLHLGNFLTILRPNISKFQKIPNFSEKWFHLNWRSYLVLTSDQKNR